MTKRAGVRGNPVTQHPISAPEPWPPLGTLHHVELWVPGPPVASPARQRAAMPFVHRRRLDLLRTALGQELLSHPVGPPLGLADAGGKPLGKLAGILGGALPESQVAADLRPVVLDRAARPFVEPEVGCRDADLAGDEPDRAVIRLGPAAREPARPGGPEALKRAASPARHGPSAARRPMPGDARGAG